MGNKLLFNSSFNSMKSLFWREHYLAAANNWEGGSVPAPVLVDCDLSNKCNHQCMWCNTTGYRADHSEDALLPAYVYQSLITTLANWGVKAVQFAGGGEPFTNPNAIEIMRACSGLLPFSIITNGSLIQRQSDWHGTCTFIGENAQWIGFSIDAGTSGTYARLKRCREDDFESVIEVISSIAECNKCKVGYKFLINEYNFHELERAARLAQMSGCHDFYARPVYWGDKVRDQSVLDHINSPTVQQSIEVVKSLANDDFRPVVSYERFDGIYNTFRFPCVSTTMMVVFGADGNIHLCCEKRGKTIYPWWDRSGGYLTDFIKWWDGDEHRKMLRDLKASDISSCPKCKYSKYNEIGYAVEHDTMDIKFL